jgi:hypothetical protein
MEEPRVEASQGFQSGLGSEVNLAVELHVMIVLAIDIGDLELTHKVHHERRRTVERVGPVLEKESIAVRNIGDVQQLSTETQEGFPSILHAEACSRLLSRSEFCRK